MIRFLLPLIIFISMVVFLAMGLYKDPAVVPSPLIGKDFPEFELPVLESPEKKFTHEELNGQVSLVNVWASWCQSCRVEHPLLVELANSNIVPIYGLNYKDDKAKALQWLMQLGNPYVINGYDAEGRVAIDLGVYGAPETYVVDKAGKIAYKHIGPISQNDWQQTLLPLITQLKMNH